MTNRFPYRAGLLCLIAATTLMAGCSSRGNKADRPDNPFRSGKDDVSTPKSERELRLEADQAYRKAHDALNTGDYETAITRYTSLIAKYPFSDYATQAELEKIFAQYRSFQADEAGIAADRFLREHPRHPNADYVQYVKGLTDFDRDSGGIIDYLPLDSSKRDVTNGRRAYDDFSILLQKFPTSRYAGDARKRMIYLRNRIAAHELSVTRYYIKRGAWVAAAKRAESIIAEYPGAPATADALLLLQDCYSRLGQKQQSEELATLIAANAGSIKAAQSPVGKAPERSVVTTVADSTPATAAAPATAAPAAVSQPSKGFFGKLSGLLDGLNKTYTIPSSGTNGTAAGASNVPASVRASAGDTESAGQASLATGPYSGPEPVVIVPTGKSDSAPVAPQAPVPAGPAATGTDTPKEKAGWFDFLNKTYTIGGPSKKAADAAPAAAAQTAPAAVTVPAAPTVAAPAVTSAVPAAAAAATDSSSDKPKEKAGWFDFLNKTYVIGGSDKKKAADAAVVPSATDSEEKTSPLGGFHVYIEEDEEEKKKAADEAAAKAANAPASSTTPTTESAK